MAKIYRVYSVDKNEFLRAHRDKQQAVEDVDSLCALDQTSGIYQVHELDEEDVTLANPVLVYERRA